MSTPSIATRLLADHARLRALADELDRLTAVDQPDVSTVAACRWEIARLVLRHLPVEERHVYRRIQAHSDPAARTLGDRFGADLETIYDAFRQHGERWTAETMAADWPGYRVSSRRLTGGLRARIEAEEAELYPLLATAPEISAERAPHERNWAADGWAIREQLGQG